MTIDTETVARLRQIVHEEMLPLRYQQDQLIRQNAHLLNELTHELGDTQLALARTRGALKGHAEGMSRALWLIMHPLIKSAAFAAAIILCARYLGAF
jgi:hypothetical protein